MTDSIRIPPVPGAIRGVVRPPGSKSLTNRAMVVSALAEGSSRLTHMLDSRDTQVMRDGLVQLGIDVRHDAENCTVDVIGCAGHLAADSVQMDLENSGTSIRFLTALCTLGRGTFQLDGNARMRQRPIGDLVSTLNALGAEIACDLANDCPPVTVRANRLPGGVAKVAGDMSSQFLSAILMAAPFADNAVELQIAGELVSKPYVEMTLSVMRAFGVAAGETSPGHYRVEPSRYQGTDYAIEPDASAASYFFAAAAVTGGEVTVEGLSQNALQGDVAFVEVLEQMGCYVEFQPDRITVRGAAAGLRGIDVDMNGISDTVQTLAAVAVFAEGPTRIHNVAHIRHKETDRIGALVTELERLGIRAEEHSDGLTIHPGKPRPAVVQTYDDHRMAMSFSIVGLRAEGIQIADPGCTAKTYPGYFDDLKKLCDQTP